MRRFLIALALLATMPVPGVLRANEPATTNAVTLPGNLVFSRGGVSGRFLYFEDWVGTRNYQIDSIVEHSGELWWAESDPDAGDEPGTDADWTKITGQSVGGGGSSITSGTADPAGGSAGDLYIQIDVSNVVQSIWNNISDTWTEYTLPTGGTDGTDGMDGATGATGAAGADGNDGNDGADGADGAAGATGATGPVGPAGADGAGTALSDVDPETVRGTGSDSGTSASASRGDHQHHLADGAVTQPKISDGSVHTSKIADGAITAPKLAAGVGGGPELTQIQVEDNTSTVFGQVSGQRVGQAIDENSPVEELRGDDLGDPEDFDSYTIKTDQGDLFVVHPTQTGHSITFTEYATFDDVAALWGFSTEHRWRGIHNQHLVLRNRQDNDVFITSSGVFFRTFGAVFRHLAHPDNWQGQWPDEVEAENHISALSQTVQYGNVLAQATMYTAGTITKDWNGYGDDVLETVANAPVYNDGQVIGNPFDADNPLSLVLAHHTSATSRNVRFFTDTTGNYDSNENFHMNFDRFEIGQRARLVAIEWTGSWAQDIRYHLEVYKEAADGTIEEKILTGSSYEPNASPGRPIRRTHRWEISATAHIVVEAGDILQIGVRNTSVGSTDSIQGDLSADSPEWSDDDAETDADFVFLGSGRYPENNPRIGDAPTLVTNLDHIFGNVKIFYSTDVDDFVDRARDFRGPYDGNTAYEAGNQVTAHGHLFIAPADIAAGTGMPNLHQLQGWQLLSSSFNFYGNLAPTLVYNLRANDWYRVGGRVFIATANASGVTGTDLTGGHANIVELTGGSGTDTTVEVDGVTVFYTIGTRTLAVQVQQDNGTDVMGSAVLPISSQVRFGMSETATDTEASEASSDAVVLTPGNLPSVDISDLNESERLCPDPSGGTANQICARNAAGDAYELVDAESTTTYQGPWQTGSYSAGEIVTRSGIAYVSLVNSNTEIPTPASQNWSGLPEGFVYRGEAPVVATNYNYGHIVLNPINGSYYIFHSTISALVAQVEIATHADFEELVGAPGHSPRVDSGDAFPTTPAPIDNDLFFFDADVASGLAWKDTDGTTDLTAATGGDLARFDGTDWIKVINLVGGGGTVNPGRTVLADAIAVDNTAGPHEITLTEAITERQLLTIFTFSSAAASPDGIGYLLSDDILALTATATAPTDAEHGLPVVLGNHAAAAFSQQSGNYFIFRQDDSTLWIRPTRLGAHTLTITATPLGGGSSTGGQQAAGGRNLVQRNIITARTPLAEFSFTTDWGLVSGTAPTLHCHPES